MTLATRPLLQKLLSTGAIAGLAGLVVHCSPGPAQTTSPLLPNDPVDTLPTIQLSTPFAMFSATAGGANPQPQTIMVTDATANGTLTDLAIGAVAYTAGPSGWLTATESPTTAPATVTLTPTLGSMTAGTYTATVWVVSSDPNVTNNPQTISVTFVVSGS
jgi:hypothetical protein